MATQTMLVIDDSGTIRALVKIFLVGLGLKYLEASSGHEGLTVARIHKPDLIMVDYKMPGMDGCEFARLIRSSSDQRLAMTQIIMLTGSANEADFAGVTRDAGINKLLAKPIVGAELLASVRALLARAGAPSLAS